jgi:hypothetical protein
MTATSKRAGTGRAAAGSECMAEGNVTRRGLRVPEEEIPR